MIKILSNIATETSTNERPRAGRRRIDMPKADTRVLTAHVPVPLAEKVDQLADRLERSRGWIMKQALSAWIAQEEERDRLTQEALADVDAGHIIDHQAVQAWADSLDTDEPLLVFCCCCCFGFVWCLLISHDSTNFLCWCFCGWF